MVGLSCPIYWRKSFLAISVLSGLAQLLKLLRPRFRWTQTHLILANKSADAGNCIFYARIRVGMPTAKRLCQRILGMKRRATGFTVIHELVSNRKISSAPDKALYPRPCSYVKNRCRFFRDEKVFEPRGYLSSMVIDNWIGRIWEIDSELFW